jgi:hypothetical protein
VPRRPLGTALRAVPSLLATSGRACNGLAAALRAAPSLRATLRDARPANKRLDLTKPNRYGPFGPSAIDRLRKSDAERWLAHAVTLGRHSTRSAPRGLRSVGLPRTPAGARGGRHSLALHQAPLTSATPIPRRHTYSTHCGDSCCCALHEPPMHSKPTVYAIGSATQRHTCQSMPSSRPPEARLFLRVSPAHWSPKMGAAESTCANH